MKYTIIMPYLRRAVQLHNTLVSYRHYYRKRDDYRVVIGEDGKNVRDEAEHKALKELLVPFRQIRKIHMETNWPECYNPCRIFNRAARETKSDYIVLTTPEIFHAADILAGFDEVLKDTPDAYIVSACANGFKTVADYEIPKIESVDEFKYSPLWYNPWRQHSEHNNRMFHWCACISRKQYETLGGFDEKYATVKGWEDYDWILRIKLAGIPIVVRDDLVTVHQWHSTDYPGLTSEESDKLFFAGRDMFHADYPGEPT